MTPEIFIVFIILAGAVVSFITERLRVDLVAVLVLLALTLTGLVTPAEVVSGFSSPAVVTICGVFILSSGLHRTGVTAMGVWQAARAVTTRLRDAKLHFGDALLLYGPREKLKLIEEEPDFIVLTQEVQEPPNYAWAPLAVFSVLVFLCMAASGWTPVCVAALASSALVVLLAPSALRTAAGCGLSPHAAMMTVAIAAAGSFNSPVSHPSNVLIMGPGDYRFVDFLKVGLPLT